MAYALVFDSISKLHHLVCTRVGGFTLVSMHIVIRKQAHRQEGRSAGLKKYDVMSLKMRHNIIIMAL